MVRAALIICLAASTAYPNDFQKYVARFRAQARLRAPLFSPSDLLPNELLKVVTFSLVENMVGNTDGKAGGCQLDPEHPKIMMDKRTWETGDEWRREVLMFHELGHCVLKRDHDAKMVERNGEEMPASIMYPYVLNRDQYLLNRDYYLDELFKGLLVPPRTDDIRLKP